jgi:hypothetical protein
MVLNAHQQTAFNPSTVQTLSPRHPSRTAPRKAFTKSRVVREFTSVVKIEGIPRQSINKMTIIVDGKSFPRKSCAYF